MRLVRSTAIQIVPRSTIRCRQLSLPSTSGLSHSLALSLAASPAVLKQFSVLNRPPPKYKGHIPLTAVEKVVLAFGSAFGAYINPRRGDLVAILGEVTAGPFIGRLRDQMLSNADGRRILRDRPRITTETLPMNDLRDLPPNTVGRVYSQWADGHGMSPDDRDDVQYIDDEECAYVMQRYRESHDFYHAVLGIPSSMVEGEVALKAFEFANTGLPMAALSLFAVARLKPEERTRFFATYLPWALKIGTTCQPLINVRWEQELATDVNVLLARLDIEKPPNLRELRKEQRRSKNQKDSK